MNEVNLLKGGMIVMCVKWDVLSLDYFINFLNDHMIA